jgi:hypothetical protein
MLHLIVLLLLTLLFTDTASAQKQAWKKTTIDDVEIVPPAGKKKGKVGDVSIIKLFYLSNSYDVKSGVIGLTGEKNDTSCEFVLYSSIMKKVLRVWLPNTCTDADGATIDGSALHSMVCSFYYEPPADVDADGGASLYLIGDDLSIIEHIYGAAGLTWHQPDCDEFRPGDKAYNTRVRRTGPYIYQHSDMTNSHLICLGNRKVLQFDPDFTSISFEGCNIVGMRCVYTGSDQSEIVAQMCVNDGGDPPLHHRHEYYLIEPADGSYKQLK